MSSHRTLHRHRPTGSLVHSPSNSLNLSTLSIYSKMISDFRFFKEPIRAPTVFRLRLLTFPWMTWRIPKFSLPASIYASAILSNACRIYSVLSPTTDYSLICRHHDDGFPPMVLSQAQPRAPIWRFHGYRHPRHLLCFSRYTTACRNFFRGDSPYDLHQIRDKEFNQSMSSSSSFNRLHAEIILIQDTFVSSSPSHLPLTKAIVIRRECNCSYRDSMKLSYTLVSFYLGRMQDHVHCNQGDYEKVSVFGVQWKRCKVHLMSINATALNYFANHFFFTVVEDDELDPGGKRIKLGIHLDWYKTLFQL
ncbi:hypothetical protein L2E82_25270 [Cichorium intybus]|uniref:Uncharacterized protein n=1 Tax=Cichorium intybus TaxID=13427 RepID=A0ACB9E2Q9_CICIN|nr:hypothetical protein L2E82_25270 [Cichorium intybus]